MLDETVVVLGNPKGERERCGEGGQLHFYSLVLMKWSLKMLKTILQNKILKIFFLKVLMLFDLLAILFGDFDEIFSTKIYAF